ncbi:MAG: ImmA/IrrE family metallo-endopeptidase [Prevotellaceae bacterium]|nr:ImmA/IrrE family metallo-endopeptidase [Prevotellaceae bacterium]
MATSILKRGFKTDAERLAKEYREKLKIHPCGALCAFKLAEHLEVPIFSATEFVSDEKDIGLLKGLKGELSEWSALTMVTKSGNRIIIHNPYNSNVRQQSDLMHELAHIICNHQRIQQVYNFEIPFGMLEYDEVQEEEAKCLGATFQLAKPCLLWARKNGKTIEYISSYFNASEEMIRYRMNTTNIKF